MKKPPRSPRRTQRSGLNYGVLEGRQVLASAGMVLSVPHQIPASQNLIVNSGFENATGGSGGVFDSSNVAGWNTLAGTANKLRLANFGGTLNNVLNLDFEADVVDGIYQDIANTPGLRYVISFQLLRVSVGSGFAAGTNDLEVFWNGSSVGAFSATDKLRTQRISVFGGSGATNRLEFRERFAADHPANDGVGPWLDNIGVHALGTNQAINGSFESVTESGNLVNPSSVFAWEAYGNPATRKIGIGRSGSARGTNHLHLDSSATNLDRVHQVIATRPNARYVVSFSARQNPATPSSLEQVRVRWGDDWAGTIVPTSDWQEYSLVVASAADSNRLVFREPNFGDGVGPLLDNIRVMRVFTPGELQVDLDSSATGNNATASYTEDSGTRNVLGNVQVIHTGGGRITGGSIVLSNGTDGSLEFIAVSTLGTNIRAIATSNGRSIGLLGVDSAANYQRVLNSLTYRNNSQNPGTTPREIRVQLEDEGNFSSVSLLTLNVNNVNDPPIINPLSDATISSGAAFSRQVTAVDPEGSALTYTLSATGTALGTGLPQPAISAAGLITWTPQQTGALTVTVRATDAVGAVSEEVFELTVVANGTLPSNFVPFSGTGQLAHVTPSARQNVYTSAPAMNLDLNKTYRAVIHTDFGTTTIELYPDRAPLAVNNFVNLARDGFYDGLIFHRVISGFVAQGGDPLGTGIGGPGYRFGDEFSSTLRFDSAGVLAMANSGPGTNGSQFFITYAAQPHLNDRHTIFGRVISGQAAIEQLQVTGSSNLPSVIRRVQILEA